MSVPAWALDVKKLAEAVDGVKVPQFSPKQGVKIVTDEKATPLNSSSMNDDSQIELLIKTLEEGVKKLSPGFKMNHVTFEKDDDTNYHMDLIAGLARMLAQIYSVPEVDKLNWT